MHRHVRDARLIPCAAATLAAAAALAITSPTRASVLYVITDTGIPMPSLTGPPFRPARINSSGQVAGWSFTNGSAAPRFFLYSNGSVTYLPSPDPTSTSVQFADINDHGDTIGTYNPAPGAPHGYVYSNGSLTDLGSFLPRAINNSGVMVGATPAGPAIYDHGALTYLAPLGAARVTDISDNGHVVGNTTSSASGPAFVYYNGVLTTLGSIGIPRAVNDSGEVVGEDSSSGTPKSYFYSPLYNSPHKFTAFGYDVGPQPSSWAYDITNNHLIAGAWTGFYPLPAVREIDTNSDQIDVSNLLAPNSKRLRRPLHLHPRLGLLPHPHDHRRPPPPHPRTHPHPPAPPLPPPPPPPPHKILNFFLDKYRTQPYPTLSPLSRYVLGMVLNQARSLTSE